MAGRLGTQTAQPQTRGRLGTQPQQAQVRGRLGGQPAVASPPRGRLAPAVASTTPPATSPTPAGVSSPASAPSRDSLLKRYLNATGSNIPEGVSLGQQVRSEIQTAREKVNPIGQSIFRGYAGAVPTLARIGQKLTPFQAVKNFYGNIERRTTLTPETDFQKELYGTDKPITPERLAVDFGVGTKAAEAERQRLGRELTPEEEDAARIRQARVSPYTLPLAAVAGFADFIPGGSEAKALGLTDDLLKIVVKSKNAAEIKGILAKSGKIAAEALDDVSRRVASIGDRKGVVSALKEAATPTRTRPSAQEARKAIQEGKSLEEFIEAQVNSFRGNVYSPTEGLGQAKNIQGIGFEDAFPSIFDRGTRLKNLEKYIAEQEKTLERLRVLKSKEQDFTKRLDLLGEIKSVENSIHVQKREMQELLDKEKLDESIRNLKLVWLTPQRGVAESYSRQLSELPKGLLGERSTPKPNIDEVSVSPKKTFDLRKFTDQYGRFVDELDNYVVDVDKLKKAIGIDISLDVPIPPEHSFQLFRGENAPKVVKELRRQGYDMVIMKEGNDINQLVLDPSIIKTKSELTDIYNAEKRATTANLSAPARALRAGGQAEPLLPKGGTKTRGFVESAREAVPNVSEKIAGQYVPRSTDTLSQKAANLVRENIQTAEQIARTGTDDKAVATATELLKHYARQAANTADGATRAALNDAAADIANTIARKLTEQGRSIQAASILGRLTPEGQVRFAAREILKWNELNPNRAIPELTGAQADEILTEMRAIQGMADGTDKAVRFQKLQDRINALVPSTLWQKLVAVWKAGLLTGVKTTGLNIFSNTSHAATETLKDAPAAAADFFLSLFTGKRTKTFTVRGIPDGVQEGAKKGFRYFDTGFDERNIAAKLDHKKVNFKNQAVQKYVDSVFRALGAQDQPFYYGALRRSLYDQAAAEATNKGITGAAREKFIDNLVHNPTDAMSVYAAADAEIAVFQNSTYLGRAASKIQEIPGAEFVVPFSRTPAAVATQVVNYSPAGALIEIEKQIERGKFDQRMLSQAIGRSTVGTGVMWVGTKLFENDLMTLDYPKTERERELWKVEGRKENSIKVGDKWRTVQTLGPAGIVLLLGGQFQRAYNDNGSISEAIGIAIAGTIKSFNEQTFLKGTNEFMDLIEDPIRNASQFLPSFFASFVPTIVNDVARATTNKEVRSSGVIQRIQSRIPGWRNRLEPQITVLGDERTRVGNPLEVLFDPTRPSPTISTPVVDELRRLTDAGFKVSPTLLGDKKGYKVLSNKENTELWKRAGEITNQKLTSLFSLPQYQSLSDEKKGDVVKDIVAKSQLVARVASVLKLTEGLQGDELKQKLSDLKAGGLLNEAVFNLYLKVR